MQSLGSRPETSKKHLKNGQIKVQTTTSRSFIDLTSDSTSDDAIEVPLRSKRAKTFLPSRPSARPPRPPRPPPSQSQIQSQIQSQSQSQSQSWYSSRSQSQSGSQAHSQSRPAVHLSSSSASSAGRQPPAPPTPVARRDQIFCQQNGSRLPAVQPTGPTHDHERAKTCSTSSATPTKFENSNTPRVSTRSPRGQSQNAHEHRSSNCRSSTQPRMNDRSSGLAQLQSSNTGLRMISNTGSEFGKADSKPHRSNDVEHNHMREQEELLQSFLGPLPKKESLSRVQPLPKVEPVFKAEPSPILETPADVKPSPKVEVCIPKPANERRIESRRAEAQILERLKRDTSLASSQASAIERAVGNHGLSKFYDDRPGQTAGRKARAQTKAKKVRRSEVKLEMGNVSAKADFNPHDLITPAEQARRLLDAKFDDVSGPPLTFVNDVDDRRLDGKFQFVDSYVCREGFKWQPPAGIAGCHCHDHCDPANPWCSCFQTAEGAIIVPYVREGDGRTVLNPKLINSSGLQQEIIECNDKCQCSRDCINRRVQKGRTVSLEIFMTERCGFGLRSPQPIKKGQFIDVYWGELLTTKEIEEYENASSENSCSYVFSLDFFTEPAAYHVQGLHFGSPTRFINHSCAPNARTFTVMMNHANKKIYKLAYFAIRDIPAMKEITFDYCPEAAREEPWLPTPGEEDEDVVRCLCGATNCRGRVWPKRQTMVKQRRGRPSRAEVES